MLNKQLLGAILPGGVRAKLNAFAFVLFAFLALTSCEDPMNDITKGDSIEIVTGACDTDCDKGEGGETPGG